MRDMKVVPKKNRCVKCCIIYSTGGAVKRMRPIERSMYNAKTREWVGLCTKHFGTVQRELMMLTLLQMAKVREENHV